MKLKMLSQLNIVVQILKSKALPHGTPALIFGKEKALFCGHFSGSGTVETSLLLAQCFY
jgi:hypothetical protein